MRLAIFFLLICPSFAFGQTRESVETPSQAVDTVQGVEFRISSSSALVGNGRIVRMPSPQGYTLALPCYPETPPQNPLQSQIDSLKAHVAALQKMVEAMSQNPFVFQDSTGLMLNHKYHIGEQVRSMLAPPNGAKVETGCAHKVTTTTLATCPPGVKCNRAICAQCGKTWQTY
ncbi:MAG: hypothetical protein E6Q97_22795 [Desulfurellales bacterium]|nr:MAG: hypothetical protein E6Q97_22795 [Desulfurellales bacterium]